MYKKLIFIICLLIFISCNKSFPDSKGEFNEIIIVSSLEDKQLLEPLESGKLLLQLIKISRHIININFLYIYIT